MIRGARADALTAHCWKYLRAASEIADEFRLALSFLTIIPFFPAYAADETRVAGSFGWFPLGGLVLGAALAGEDGIIARFFEEPLRSMIVVASLVLLTGCVHLDGLGDTADALSAGRDRERALEILRDSRLGSFGAIAIFLVLGLKLLSLARIRGEARVAALCIALAAGRWAMVASSHGLDYLRAQGAGAAFVKRRAGRNLGVASGVAAVSVLAASFWVRRISAAAVIAILLTLALRSFYRRWLGGITGDLMGAAGELCETAVLVVLAAR